LVKERMNFRVLSDFVPGFSKVITGSPLESAPLERKTTLIYGDEPNTIIERG